MLPSPFLYARRILETERVMFHGKQSNKGYYPTAFCCETFHAIASNKVIKGYKRLADSDIPITFYNLVISDKRPTFHNRKQQNNNLLEKVSRETFLYPFHTKSPFLRKGQARLRAGDRSMKKSC